MAQSTRKSRNSSSYNSKWEKKCLREKSNLSENTTFPLFFSWQRGTPYRSSGKGEKIPLNYTKGIPASKSTLTVLVFEWGRKL